MKEFIGWLVGEHGLKTAEETTWYLGEYNGIELDDMRQGNISYKYGNHKSLLSEKNEIEARDATKNQ